MRNRWTLVVVAACLGATPLFSPAAAPLADRIPAGSLAYVGWAGRSLTFDGSMLGQLLNDPAIRGIFETVRAGIEKEVRPEDERKAFAHAWEMARIAWQRPMAAALIDLKKGAEDPEVLAVALVDLGKEKDEFRKHLDALLEMAKEDVTFAKLAVGAAEVFVHKPRRGPQVSYGFLENTMFFAIGQGVPELLVQLAPAKALPADKQFAACLAAVDGKDVQMAYYVDVAGLSERARQFLPPGEPGQGQAPAPADQMKRMIAALGLDKSTAVAGTIQIVERGMYSRSRVFSPGPHQGVLMPLAGTPITEADLAGVPDDADIVVACKLSAGAAYTELRRVIGGIEPGAEEEFAKAVGAFEEELGISLTRDLFPSLGETWVFSSAPSQGGFLTGSLLSVSVKDAAKLAATIKKIEAKLQPPAAEGGAAPPPPGSGPRLETLKAGRTDIRYLAGASRHSPWPVAPAWAVYKDRFYLAPYPQVIQSIILANGRKPITQSPDFVKVRSRLADKPSILAYVNGPKIVRQVYHWALIGWTLGANVAAGETDVPVSPSWLPPISTIEQYLWPQICSVSADAEGITFESYGSLPSPSVFAPLLFNQAAAWGVFPVVHQARGQARGAMEMNQVRQVAMALMMYKVDQARMPASLKDAKMGEYLGGGPIAGEIAAGKYSYLPPEGNKDKDRPAPRTILVYLPVGPDRPFAIAAFADGHVERLEPERFERMLKEQLDGPAPAPP